MRTSKLLLEPSLVTAVRPHSLLTCRGRRGSLPDRFLHTVHAVGFDTK